jgi:hypothetical protein
MTLHDTQSQVAQENYKTFIHRFDSDRRLQSTQQLRDIHKFIEKPTVVKNVVSLCMFVSSDMWLLVQWTTVVRFDRQFSLLEQLTLNQRFGGSNSPRLTSSSTLLSNICGQPVEGPPAFVLGLVCQRCAKLSARWFHSDEFNESSSQIRLGDRTSFELGNAVTELMNRGVTDIFIACVDRRKAYEMSNQTKYGLLCRLEIDYETYLMSRLELSVQLVLFDDKPRDEEGK